MPLRRHIIFHLHARVLGHLTVQDRTVFINYLTLPLPLPLSLALQTIKGNKLILTFDGVNTLATVLTYC
jgi:hypothetical protein